MQINGQAFQVILLINSFSSNQYYYRFFFLSANIDAAFAFGSTIFFFKGTQYWRFDNHTLKYNRTYNVDFENIPNNLDAAFYWESMNKAFVFKDDKFWEINIFQYIKPYSESISKWNGIPRNIDGALEYDDRIRFFKDNKFYELNSTDLSVNFIFKELIYLKKIISHFNV